MTNKKTFCINRLLYEARLKKGVSIKDAAKALEISSLYLKLVEKGYLNVRLKYQVRFIEYYKLEYDFFIKYSRHVSLTNKEDLNEDKKLSQKQAKRLSKLWIKIASSFIIAGSIGSFTYGTFAMNKQTIDPRSAWTEKFTTMITNARAYGTPGVSILITDVKYTIQGDTYTVFEENHKIETTTKLNVYKRDSNSSDLNIEVWNNVYNKDDDQFLFTINYDISCYNKKKIIYSNYFSNNAIPDIYILNALCFLNEEKTLDLVPFSYIDVDGTTCKAEIGSAVYQQYFSLFNKHIYYAYDSFGIGLLAKAKAAGFDLAYDNLIDLISDTQKVSREYVRNFRLGNSLRIFSSIIFALSFGALLLSIISSVYLKKKEEKPIAKFDYIPMRSYETSPPEIKNDFRHSPFIPEFGLKAVGLIIIFLSSLFLFMTAYTLLNGNFFGFKDVNAGRKLINNFLIAGTTILFLTKIDIYSKKTIKQLLTNILILFLAGFIYYQVEITLYQSITSQGNIFSILLEVLTTIIPGNVIWNLMMYSFIFLFLFTTPSNIKDNKKALLIYRLLSLLPVMFLIFAFIYKHTLEGVISAPYWVSFMLYSKGFLITTFVIVYLYGLYFHRHYLIQKYGINTCEEIYFNSRRYIFSRNGFAAALILILYAVDISFKYAAPNNILGLGNNWSILLLIPFIIFYHPHLGKRNKHWDNIYILLLAVSYSIGYILTIIMIIDKLNLSQLLLILF